jgi:hypothetical protein
MKDNKLIAEFMGGQRVLPDKDVYNMPTHNNLCYGIDELHYHTSWNWLMPVVEKIRKIPSYDRDQFGTKVILNGRKIKIVSGSYGDKRGHDKTHFNKSFDGTLYQREIEGIYGKSDDNYSPIRITYYAVIEFIKWYNK